MFRHLIPRILRQTKPQKVCGFCARPHGTSQAGVQSPTWKLATAVCLERYPVITPEMTEIEKEYNDLLTKIEIENSLLSEHEDQIRIDKQVAQQKLEDGDDDDENVSGVGETLTALDKEDKWDAESNAYSMLQSRTSEHDKDFKSTKRKLDRKLVLIVQQNVGGKPIWILPQGDYNQEDSLKEAAESVLQERCGTNLKSEIFSNAPSGMYKYHLPKKVSESVGASGLKVFFYRAEFKGGNVDMKDQDILDYKWVTIEELSDYMVPEYEKAVKQFVLEY